MNARTHAPNEKQKVGKVTFVQYKMTLMVHTPNQTSSDSDARGEELQKKRAECRKESPAICHF